MTGCCSGHGILTTRPNILFAQLVTTVLFIFSRMQTMLLVFACHYIWFVRSIFVDIKVLITIYPPTFTLFPSIPHPLLYSSLIQLCSRQSINPLPLSLALLFARMCVLVDFSTCPDAYFVCHLCALYFHISNSY